MDKEFFLNFFCQKVCRCQKRLYLCSLLSQRGQRKRKPRKRKGSLAQLVQSVCLTSRGSGVRIPQLPQAKSFKIKASDSSGAFLFSRKNTICCIYVGVVVVTRGKGKNENRFCLHEVVLQKSLQDRSIKTDTEADSHHGDAQIY